MGEHDHMKPPAIWMRNLLLGSLALNVFLAGFLFAKVIAPGEKKTAIPATQIDLATLPSDLPPGLREEFQDKFRPYRKEIEKDYEALVEARIRVRDLLEKKEFKEGELRDALHEVGRLQAEIQTKIQNSLVDAMQSMDPELRQVFVVKDSQGVERGIWAQRSFDGTRWKVKFDNGEIVLDLEGVTNDNKNNNQSDDDFDSDGDSDDD